MQYSIGIGDYSNDGHGRCDRYTVESIGDFDLDDIAKAYKKSRKELGLGIEDIANEYESWPTKEDAQVFVDAGIEWPAHWKDSSRDTLVEALEDNWDEYIWVHVFEFMVARNLPGFNLKIITNDLPVLFGDWNAVATDDFIGYGTFI